MKNFSSGACNEELYCPICNLNFFSITSIEMHFNNRQHIERYQLVKNEIHDSFEGPLSMIKHL